MSVSYHGRIVMVRVSHIGIDEGYIRYIMDSQTFKKQVEKFRQEFKVITEMAKKNEPKNKMPSPAMSPRRRSANNMLLHVRGVG